jgi:replication initiation and membrane attachment protein DnaB
LYRSKGSVLVDYIVQINATAARHLDTLELKRMFHESLKQAPPPPTTSTTTTTAHLKDEDETLVREQSAAQAAVPPTKPRLQLGQFVLDPDYTDFVGE